MTVDGPRDCPALILLLEDFERLVSEGYTSRAAEPALRVWDGYIPEPREP
jgi:hypothetical protein